eukprot:6243386-Pyramimonas_sp.AAC.1
MSNPCRHSNVASLVDVWSTATRMRISYCARTRVFFLAVLHMLARTREAPQEFACFYVPRHAIGQASASDNAPGDPTNSWMTTKVRRLGFGLSVCGLYIYS